MPFGIKLYFYCQLAYNYSMKIFCERLKELRQDKNLTTKQLGKNLQVSDSTITRWENGLRVPSIDNLYNIAVYFNVSADFLLGLEN